MQLEINESEIINELARRQLSDFVECLMPNYDFTTFHNVYIAIIQAFAFGRIKKLIVSVPPQHGKSEISTRLLPAFLFGLNPNLKIAIGSYSATLAMSFNRDVQRYIDNDKYADIFPETSIICKHTKASEGWLRNANEFEIVEKKGSLKAVGRGGGLTGHPVDVMIMDDIFKDYEEGNSPVVRESAWQWYVNTVKTRLHNDSQELIVFTRWHEDDIIGRIESSQKVVEIKSLSDIDNITDEWVKINFEAIKETPATEIDNRLQGEPLYEKRHDRKNLDEKRSLDGVRFDCLYQGKATTKKGMLYSDFNVYDVLPTTKKKANLTDTADTGTDVLCSICYERGLDDNIYVIDVLYTQDPMEITEKSLPEMLLYNKTKDVLIESNNGGRGFARVIEKASKEYNVEWYHQTANKEARIITNASTVNKKIFFPTNWISRWGRFSSDLRNFKKLFKANKQDGAPDVLTAIVEKEFGQVAQSGIGSFGY